MCIFYACLNFFPKIYSPKIPANGFILYSLALVFQIFILYSIVVFYIHIHIIYNICKYMFFRLSANAFSCSSARMISTRQRTSQSVLYLTRSSICSVVSLSAIENNLKIAKKKKITVKMYVIIMALSKSIRIQHTAVGGDKLLFQS